MGKRKGDDAEGSITSVGRIGKGSADGWKNGRDRTDDDAPASDSATRPLVYGWGKDGVEGMR